MARHPAATRLVVTTAALAMASTIVPPTLASAAPRAAATAVVTPCARYADPTGSDANSGLTPQTAKRSPLALLDALAPGETGCLRDGAVFTFGPGEAITSAAGAPGLPKTLRATTPGARATITTTSGLWFRLGAHDLVLQGLDIRRSAGGGGSLLMVDGDRITLDDVDLTYPHNICLDVGDDARAGATDPTEDFVLRNSRVHDCGSAYGPPRVPNDSGVHGIYLQYLRDGGDADDHGAVLEGNVIARNHNRGLQLYPDADDVLVRHNVLYGNGANLNLGSQGTIASERNVIVDNIIAESRLDGLSPGGFVGDTSEVLGNYAVVTDAGNRVERNCIINSRFPQALYAGRGFTRHSNIEQEDPRFVDADRSDFRLHAGSPCTGKGLQTAPPTEPPADDCTIRGTDGNDVLVGTAGDDIICGGGGHDLLLGGAGHDLLLGGPDHDVLQGGSGDDRIDGGSGDDTVDYLDAVAGVSVNLLGGNDAFCSAAACGTGYDRIDDGTVERIGGSSFGDTLVGDERANVVDGRGGADTLSGESGADRVVGGPGSDILLGRADGDVLRAGSGHDVLYGDDGVDRLDGGIGRDRCDVGDDGGSLLACELRSGAGAPRM